MGVCAGMRGSTCCLLHTYLSPPRGRQCGVSKTARRPLRQWPRCCGTHLNGAHGTCQHYQLQRWGVQILSGWRKHLLPCMACTADTAAADLRELSQPPS